MTRVRALSDLKALKAAMQREAREAQVRAAERAAQEARARHEQDLFQRSVGPVTRLPGHGRATLDRTRPSPEPRQRQLDDAAVLREALSDEMDVERLLETDEALSYRRDGVGPEVVRKLRRGVWVVHGEIDLHGLRSDEAREQLGAFIQMAGKCGWRCVRVVHGKGHGSPGRVPVLKAKTQRWLVQKQEVMAFVQARASEGGAGALVVLLRPVTRPATRTVARAAG